MTILHGENGKTIQYSVSNTIHECDKNMCIVEMPTVICNNKRDAMRIQIEVGSFIGKLSKKLLEE